MSGPANVNKSTFWKHLYICSPGTRLSISKTHRQPERGPTRSFHRTNSPSFSLISRACRSSFALCSTFFALLRSQHIHPFSHALRFYPSFRRTPRRYGDCRAPAKRRPHRRTQAPSAPEAEAERDRPDAERSHPPCTCTCSCTCSSSRRPAEERPRRPAVERHASAPPAPRAAFEADGHLRDYCCTPYTRGKSFVFFFFQYIYLGS